MVNLGLACSAPYLKPAAFTSQRLQTKPFCYSGRLLSQRSTGRSASVVGWCDDPKTLSIFAHQNIQKSGSIFFFFFYGPIYNFTVTTASTFWNTQYENISFHYLSPVSDVLLPWICPGGKWTATPVSATGPCPKSWNSWVADCMPVLGSYASMALRDK